MATYEVQTDGGTYQVDTEDKPETSWSDVPKNALGDIKGIAKTGVEASKNIIDPVNIWESAAAGSLDPTKEKLSGDFEKLKGMPGAVLNEAKQTLTHPIETFKQHPINTALNVAGAAGAVGEGLGMLGEAGEGAKVAELAKEPPPIPEAHGRVPPSNAEPINIPSEAADILKKANEPKPPPPPIPEKPVSPDPMQQVNDYVKKQYEKTAQKPGIANVAADYLKEHSQNMTLKELGAAPGQVRKIGVDRAHELADYALENNLAGPKIGSIGREKLIPKRLEEAGGAVGAFRKMATDRGAKIEPNQLIDQVRANLDQKYLTSGMYSGQKGLYMKALSELKKTDGTAESLSDKVSEIFREAKKADRLKQPSGPLADVARQVRDINHNLISKTLTPEEMSLYEKSLEDYGALTQIHEFVKRRGSTEAGGRLGPGSGISRAMVQKFLDSVGYRTEAKVASKLSDFIRKNPDVMTRPKDIFRKYVDEAADAVDEMGDQQ